MKSLRYKLLKSLLAVIAATGFASCHRDKISNRHIVMYGPLFPVEVHLKVSGTVTDTQSNPIPGIKVNFKNIENKSVYTSADGSFCVDKINFAFNDTLKLQFTDVDSTENGGLFASKSVDIVVTDDEKKELYEFKNLNIKLDKQE